MRRPSLAVATLAWVLAALFYFYQYALRSAPSVMIPQLTATFGVDALGVASIVGLFYYSYSPFSLVAGAAMDRFGAKWSVPAGAASMAVGALLFATGNVAAASLGRLLQGAGGVFSGIGAIYIASKYFPAAYAASLIGATQMFGMAGGSAGQLLVGPLIQGGLSWRAFWAYAGIGGLVVAAILVVLLPREPPADPSTSGAASSLIGPLKRVFVNPQSILCGFIAGLLFIPTTILDMTWGVRFLQEGRSREYAEAVRIAATVPFGWMIGCPLLGYVSDRIGRRKPVILAGTLALAAILAWVLYGEPIPIFRGATVGIAMGIASGAAMLPYTVIKEVNAPELAGTATGVVSFINFTFSALLGPVFARLLVRAAEGSATTQLVHYQSAFAPMLVGVLVAAALACLLRETGPAAERSGGANAEPVAPPRAAAAPR
jgi:MFS family permease